jgi:hypothetical protein
VIRSEEAGVAEAPNFRYAPQIPHHRPELLGSTLDIENEREKTTPLIQIIQKTMFSEIIDEEGRGRRVAGPKSNRPNPPSRRRPGLRSFLGLFLKDVSPNL